LKRRYRPKMKAVNSCRLCGEKMHIMEMQAAERAGKPNTCFRCIKRLEDYMGRIEGSKD
jgi:hypothetical protein